MIKVSRGCLDDEELAIIRVRMCCESQKRKAI